MDKSPSPIEAIREAISVDAANARFQSQGIGPLFAAHPKARLVVVGQAPGIKAQTAGIPWGDESGRRLMQWLGIEETVFRDITKVSLLPMDFYYPGKGKSGDLPPRKEFAARWHPQLLAHMPQASLIVLAGKYAVDYYLGKNARKNLTETVRAYQDYLPRYFPIVHPSPLNFRWHLKNPWFMEEVVPALQQSVAALWTS